MVLDCYIIWQAILHLNTHVVYNIMQLHHSRLCCHCNICTSFKYFHTNYQLFLYYIVKKDKRSYLKWLKYLPGIELILYLQENPSKHPIIILKDVPFSHLQAILEFMYAGEVNVSQEQLPAFLKTADRLKVKGLAEAPQAIKREG